MSSSRQADLSVEEGSEPVDKGSLASRASTISSGKVLVVQGKGTHSEIYSKSSRKCSEVAVVRGVHRGDHSNKPKVRTLL